jgi:hypothetical protein
VFLPIGEVRRASTVAESTWTFNIKKLARSPARMLICLRGDSSLLNYTCNLSDDKPFIYRI